MKQPAFLAAACLLLPGIARAQVDISQVWVNPGFYSLHFDRNKGLDDANPGIGFEWPIDKTFSLTAGTFRNSDRDQSDYAGLYVMPFEFYGVKFGAVVGGFNGYQMTRNGGWFAALIPVAAIEGRRFGLNIAIIPTIKDRLYGAISFQLKFRFSDGSAP
jgi:hypothetical protein